MPKDHNILLNSLVQFHSQMIRNRDMKMFSCDGLRVTLTNVPLYFETVQRDKGYNTIGVHGKRFRFKIKLPSYSTVFSTRFISKTIKKTELHFNQNSRL